MSTSARIEPAWKAKGADPDEALGRFEIPSGAEPGPRGSRWRSPSLPAASRLDGAPSD